MITLRSVTFVFIPLLCLILTGCVQLPDELRSPADTDVVTDYATLAALSSDGKDAKAELTTVRIRGVIASIDNQAKQTRLVLVSLPIGHGGRPDIDQEPQGRFVVYVSRFLDPMAYHKGRLLTVLGTADGVETIKVGEHSQSAPVIQGQGVHLWTITQRVMTDRIAPLLAPCNGIICRYQGPSEGQIINTVE